MRVYDGTTGKEDVAKWSIPRCDCGREVTGTFSTFPIAFCECGESWDCSFAPPKRIEKE